MSSKNIARNIIDWYLISTLFISGSSVHKPRNIKYDFQTFIINWCDMKTFFHSTTQKEALVKHKEIVDNIDLYKF